MTELRTPAEVRGPKHKRASKLDPAERESACRFIQSLVSVALGVQPAELCSDRRGPAAVALARQAAMYLAHVCLGMCLSRVGEQFGRDRTTVAYACARMEDRRDNPSLDRVLACLEAALDRWRRSAIPEDAP